MIKAQKIFFPGQQFVCLNFSLAEYKTYLLSLLFAVSGVVTPYLFHHFNLAGQIFLPIYFFVLIGAYKFGWRVGMITAISAPLLSFGLSGMPVISILPLVIIKGCLLASIAGFTASQLGKLSVLSIFSAVFSYQLLGFAIVYLFTHDINLALMDLRMGYPGLILQVIGGFALLTNISKYEGKKLETDLE